MPGRHRPPAEPRTAVRRCLLAMVALALAATTSDIWTDSDAAFSGKTANTANRWQTGTVTFGANAPATALFNLSNVIPGSFGSACVKLTYTGTAPAAVDFSLLPARLTGTGLGSYVTLRVRDGTGTQADCSDFVTSNTLYNSIGMNATGCTVTALSAAGSCVTNASNWAATTNATRSYRFDWQVQDHNAAEGLTMTAAFTWQAQG